MEHIRTEYEATLRRPDGKVFRTSLRNFSEPYSCKPEEEMWAVYYPWNEECALTFFQKNMDSELYDAGYFKITNIERIKIYEEREPVI